MVSTSPRRPSKFIESLPTSSNDHQMPFPSPTSSNELFASILNEMDEFESRHQSNSPPRERGASQSSFESLPSSSSSPRTTSAQPIAVAVVDRSHTVKEGNRRSINFTRSSLDKELEGSNSGSNNRRRSGSSSNTVDGDASTTENNTGDRLAKKFVGRLRALTGGRDKSREAKPYAGT